MPFHLRSIREKTVTTQINNIVSLAIAENDHASNQFLQWYVDEQVEEVDSMTTLLQTIKHAGPYLLLVEDYVASDGCYGSSGCWRITLTSTCCIKPGFLRSRVFFLFVVAVCGRYCFASAACSC